MIFTGNTAQAAIKPYQAIDTTTEHKTKPAVTPASHASPDTGPGAECDIHSVARPPLTHVGKMVREVFDRLPKGCNIGWFARQLNCNRSNIYDIFNRPTLDTELLRRISIILHHDFFRDLSDHLTPDLQVTDQDTTSAKPLRNV